MVSYIWQNISSGFWSATAACRVWSVQSPAIPPPPSTCWLLAPVHKQGFHRRLRDAGVTDTALQMNHSRPIPSHSTGLCAKGHKYPESPLPTHAQSSHKTRALQMTLSTVSRSKLISKWTKQMQSQNDTVDLHLSLIVCKDVFLYAWVSRGVKLPTG